MSTKIEWVKNRDGTPGVTWNPITGCTPISEGCAHCYAKRMANRMRGRFGYPADDPFRVTLHLDKMDQPMHWEKPRRIFVCSMGDLFHEDVIYGWSYKVLHEMYFTDRHTYFILTKRHKRVVEALTKFLMPYDVYSFDHVFVGITAENQRRLDERMEILVNAPVHNLYISAEPLLGPLDLTRWHEYLRWVIVGGETGPGFRGLAAWWVEDIRDQCIEFGIPFFFKSWGGMPKRPDHRLLHGREWNEVPEGVI